MNMLAMFSAFLSGSFIIVGLASNSSTTLPGYIFPIAVVSIAFCVYYFTLMNVFNKTDVVANRYETYEILWNEVVQLSEYLITRFEEMYSLKLSENFKHEDEQIIQTVIVNMLQKNTNVSERVRLWQNSR